MSHVEVVLKRLYVLLSDPSGHGAYPEAVTPRIFPHLNHLSDLYLISEDLLGDWASVAQFLEEIRSFLEQWRFCRLNLRPVHPVRVGETRQLKDLYQILHQGGAPFHREALQHQVASRWMVLPVLRARADGEARNAAALASFLRERMMIPSLCLPQGPGWRGWADRFNPDRERILLEEPDGVLESLILHDLFDDLQGWALSSAGGFSLESCASLIVDCAGGTLRRCHRQEARNFTDLDRVLSREALGECLSCWNELPGRIREALRWNRREEEGGRVEHQLGVYALSRGDLRAADGHLRSVSTEASSPDLRGESLLYLGILRLQEGQVEKAHQDLTEALALIPDSSSVIYHLGRCAFSWRDYIEAADLFRKALDLGLPPEAERDVRLQLGISHVQLGEFPEALAAMGAAGQQASAPVHFYRGVALVGLGRLEEALACFETALASGPEGEDVSSIQFYAGHCLKEMDRLAEAIAHLVSALEADSRNYEAWNLLGFCRFRTGRHHEAIQAFLKALELNPRSAIDHANIGSNLRDLGDLQGAVQWYRKAIRLDPTLGWAAQNLERLEARMRET